MVVALAWGSPANAGIGSCGNIDVEADAECQLEVEGGCESHCKPVNFVGACSAELYAACKGTCDLDADANCTGTCQGDCEGECGVDPGNFDCEATCQGNCEANCSGECQSSDNKTECKATCKATCSGECSASCKGTPPSAKCAAKCEASCSGQCKATANLECQGTCQAKGYANCTGRLEGGCTTECSEPDGALFCDGQYVDRGDNLKECISALNAYLESHVDVSASSSGSCTGNTCEGEAEAEVSSKCSLDPRALDGTSNGITLAGAGLLLAALRRRRTR
jgi:hypothetical protein